MFLVTKLISRRNLKLPLMQQQQAEAHYQKALQFHNTGKYKKAEALYRKILRHYPRLGAVQINLGATLYAQEKYPEALKVFEKAIAENPTLKDAYTHRASVLYMMGELPAAVAAYEEVCKMDPKAADAFYNLANVHMASGQYAEAETAYRKALALAPNLYQAQYNLGMLQLKSGDTAAARQSFVQTLAMQPGYSAAAVNLGNLEMDCGNLAAAERAYTNAVEVNPQYALGFQARAKLRLDLGKLDEALQDMDIAYGLDSRDVGVLTLRGNALDSLGKTAEAEAMFRAALALDPENAAALRNLRRLQSRKVPAWHFTMLADSGRNAAYEAAIERAIGPDSVVLDIGTGSGLLAMMAARAGAQHVHACELVPALAEAARDIVTANGYTDRITVHARSSATLSVGKDLPQKANVVVSEILDAALIGEGVLPSLRHAAQALATEDMLMIPAGATVWAALVALPNARQVNPVREISGFDLSEFDRFRRLEGNSVVYLEREAHEILSKAVQVENFDFANLPPAVADLQPLAYPLTFPILETGTAHAILIWFDLHLDDSLTVSSGKDGEMVHWGQAVSFLSEDLAVEVGESVELTLYRTDVTWLTVEE